MLELNRKTFDRLGITKWHERGYTGKRGLSVTYEYFSFESDKGGHGLQTAKVFKEVAPDRKLVHVSDSTKDVAATAQWIFDNNADTGFRSMQSDETGNDEIYAKTLPFCSLFNSAGNDNTADYAKAIRDEYWFGVASAGFGAGVFSPASYSSYSEYVDFAAVDNVYIQYSNGIINPFSGTSCAAPVLAGMASLVNDFFYERKGRPLSHDEMYWFIKAHCLDVSAPGKDIRTGWGVFILPDPATINPDDWMDNMEIKLKIGSRIMLVDGVEHILEQAPFVDPTSGRTVMPLRAPMEALGHKVIWDKERPLEILIVK